MFVKQRIKIYLSVIILLSAALGIPAFTVYAESKTMAVLEDAQETQETSVESQTKEKMLAVTSSTTSSTDDLPSSSPVSEQTDNSQKKK